MALRKEPLKLPKKQEKRSIDPDFNAQVAKLTRYNLGAISVEDLMDIDNDPAGDGEDRKQYVARIHGMMEILQREVRRAIALQIDFNSRWSENWDQTLFGRGGINSVEALLERWEKLSAEHLQNINDEKNKKEDFNQFNPAPEAEYER